MKLSEKIKALRKGAGLSQEEFGARLNVSRQAITKWESGEGLPDIGNLQYDNFEFGGKAELTLVFE